MNRPVQLVFLWRLQPNAVKLRKPAFLSFPRLYLSPFCVLTLKEKRTGSDSLGTANYYRI